MKDGDLVKVITTTNRAGEWDLAAGNKKPMVGKLIFAQTMKPGVISFALGFGRGSVSFCDTYVKLARVS